MPPHYRKKNVNAYMEDKGSSIESNQFVLSLLILTDYTPRSKEVICEADLVVGRSLDRSLPPLVVEKEYRPTSGDLVFLISQSVANLYLDVGFEIDSGTQFQLVLFIKS